ncbi:MAG: hypothetical protein LBH14_05905 [Desulfobulbaceae bacterium]|jgi:hypothetical protein|nr:hypothetical protein [Desulfobulbaceae bacterium]
MIKKAIFAVVVLFGVFIFAVQTPVARSTETGLVQPPANFDGPETWAAMGGDPANYDSANDPELWAYAVHSYVNNQTTYFKSLGFDDATAQKKALETSLVQNPDYAPVYGYTIHNDQNQIHDPLNLYQVTQYSSAPGGDSATKKLLDFKEAFTSIYINDKTFIERPWLEGKSKDQFWQEYLAQNGLNEGLTVDQYMARLRASGKVSKN